MKKNLFLLLLLTLIPSSGGILLAQSKFLFNPGVHVDNPFKNEISGGAIIAGLEYRPESFFGLEARAKLGFYGFSKNIYPYQEGVSGVYYPSGYMHYRFNSPQIGIAPRFYKDLEIFYDGLSIYVEPEFSFGIVSGDIEITGDNEFYKAFSESISYYSISIGLELWEDRSHEKKRDIIIAASFGFTSWSLKKPFEKHIPASYDGGKPLLDTTVRIGFALKLPIGTKLGAK